MSRRSKSRGEYLSRRSRRSRLRLILSESETVKLDRAVADSGAMFRSLIIAEAINAGLSKHGNLTLTGEKRSRRVDVWLPKGIGELVKQAAQAHSTTQQNLLRHFLLEYVENGGWKAIETTELEEESVSGEEAQAS